MERDGIVNLLTKVGRDCMRWYPEVVQALRDLPGGPHVLDGEACVMRPDGTSDFTCCSSAHLRRSPALPATRRAARCNSTTGANQATKTKKATVPGRARDRARVAGGQNHDAQYEAKKTGKPAAAVKKAVKSVGNSRKKVERELGKVS